MSDGDVCGCFPAADDLAAEAERARNGEIGVPHVGDGSTGTVLSCPHGSYRLGDLLGEPEGPAACAGTTRSGEPCKAPPGDDGFCPAHRPKDGSGDGAGG